MKGAVFGRIAGREAAAQAEVGGVSGFGGIAPREARPISLRTPPSAFPTLELYYVVLRLRAERLSSLWEQY